MTINFPKQYNSPEDLAELLSQRGLVFDDKERVCRYIRHIGYYRLSAYFYPFLEIPKDRQIFKQGSNFDAAIKLYRFDKKLRLFIFNEIEKIEVSLRSTLANVMAKADSHNAYPKLLLPSCKGMEQAVCHKPDGGTENETALDK